MISIKKMNPEAKVKWLGALRSGEYKQGQDALHNKVKDTFCCLGVLCDVAIKNGVDLEITNPDEDTFHFVSYDHTTYYLPHKVMEWAGLEHDNPLVGDGYYTTTVAKMNDKGESFAEIALAIDQAL